MMWPKNKLTRFEFVRLLGARSLQIALGAPLLVKVEEVTNPINLAKAEFKNKLLPITIKRKLPSNEEIVIEINEAIENWMEDHPGEL
jgi:DNA-directed RNA polymerase subunit K/omega